MINLKYLLSCFNLGYCYVKGICGIKLYHAGGVEMKNIVLYEVGENKNVLSGVSDLALGLELFVKLVYERLFFNEVLSSCLLATRTTIDKTRANVSFSGSSFIF